MSKHSREVWKRLSINIYMFFRTFMALPQKTVGNISLDMLAFGTWGMGGYKEHDVHNDDDRDRRAIQNPSLEGCAGWRWYREPFF